MSKVSRPPSVFLVYGSIGAWALDMICTAPPADMRRLAAAAALVLVLAVPAAEAHTKEQLSQDHQWQCALWKTQKQVAEGKAISHNLKEDSYTFDVDDDHYRILWIVSSRMEYMYCDDFYRTLRFKLVFPSGEPIGR